MEIYSLSGPSGTGKSTSALEFAHQRNIEGIIAGQLAPGINVALSKARGVENTPLISKFLARTSKNLSSLKYNDSPKADLGKPAPYRPRVKTKDFYK